MGRGAAIALSAPALIGSIVTFLGARALTRTSRPITASPTDLRQIDQGTVVAKAEQREEVLAAMSAVLEFQQAHPDAFYYTRTRIYTAPYLNADGTTDPAKLVFTFFDEFDNYLVYFAALLTAVAKQPRLVRYQRGLLKYSQSADPADKRAHTTWTERQELRVTVESRKPLYPAGGTGKDPSDDVIIADERIAAIKKVDRADALLAVGERLAYESSHPDQFYFNRVRVFTAPYPGDRSKELLMVLYEADDHDKYRESFAATAGADADYRALVEKADSYVLDDPQTRTIIWTELQEMRIQYESREPLYPSRGDGDAAQAPEPSVQDTSAKADVLKAAARSGRSNPLRHIATNLITRVPSALAGQVALEVQNVSAALQTRDPKVFVESTKLGARRTGTAVVDALDAP
jgi:hypothetical protein